MKINYVLLVELLVYFLTCSTETMLFSGLLVTQMSQLMIALTVEA